MIKNPHELAQAGLVFFTGDLHPIDHNGAWFDASTWETDGYASCVRVSTMPDGPADGHHVIVELLTINAPDNIMPALRCCGQELDPRSPGSDIDCCLAYGYYEPDESDYRKPSCYAFVILDHDADPADFTQYARIHGATVVSDETPVWELLNRLVGRELHA